MRSGHSWWISSAYFAGLEPSEREQLLQLLFRAGAHLDDREPADDDEGDEDC
jgi:hypothetical protein